MMLTALAALPFVLALVLAAGIIVRLLHQNGDKMLAALKGESLLATPVLTTMPTLVRTNARLQRVAVTQPARLRAAA